MAGYRAVIRRAFTLFWAIILVGSIVLLLNFTASNPTGRRTSSRDVVVSGAAATVGRSAEDVLARDLGVPNNNAAGNRQCLCNQRYDVGLTPNDCRACIVYNPAVATYRLPDFITDDYIADSKNVAVLRDIRQLREVTAAALAMEMPFWVFVRVDTVVDPAYVHLVEATGGGVVYYFAGPGYADPVTQDAQSWGVLAAICVFVGMSSEVRYQRRRRRPVRTGGDDPGGGRPGKTSGTPDDLMQRARRRVDRADAEQSISMDDF